MKLIPIPRGAVRALLMACALLPLAAATLTTASASSTLPTRVMENLGRGVVAVRVSSSKVFVSWRLLGLDPSGIGFNLYRSANGAAPVKLNTAPLTEGTNFTDTTSDKTVDNVYSVRSVLKDLEQPQTSAAFKLTANHAGEPVARVPLSPLPAAGYSTKYVWVGDLDGDGEYDYVIDRLSPGDPNHDDWGLGNQFLEAYKRDGTRLWQIDMGPNSRYLYNIHPSSATLSMGMYDGATVYDLNGDGKAEVILKIANGVKFGDGTTFVNADDNRQYLAVIDGQTGKMLANAAFPTTFYADGAQLGTQLGIGYADGIHPSVYFWGRNRNANKTFNDVFASWSWSGGSTITKNWEYDQSEHGGGVNRAAHQMRIIDVDGDGKDEVATGNFLLNSDGTLRYVLPGVGHGDRFFIGKFDKKSVGMQGYGIQQNNESGLLEYYYDATNGGIQWTHSTTPGNLIDVGRGLVGDVDPRFPGFEIWSFSGLYNGPTNTRTEPSDNQPYASHSIWWDADTLTEGLNDVKIEKWNPANPTPTNGTPRLLTLSDYDGHIFGHNPMFFGDIFGDWRTEVVTMNSTQTELIIFTTDIPTSQRLYTMAQNPAYRDHMTIKGYMQSPLPDYYLGDGMAKPPKPAIKYAGNTGTLQAEIALLDGGTTVSTDRSGYTGTGFLDFSGTGGSAQFDRIGGGKGGVRTIQIRYANGSGATRAGVLKVNGVAQKIKFPATGGWTAWVNKSVSVTLESGPGNILRLESNGQDLANIDWIKVSKK